MLHRMGPVTPQTKLADLKARLRNSSRNVDGATRLVRSVQQSLKVEGYDVREEVLRAALRRVLAAGPR
jgi:hypothetical protein